MKQHVIDNFHLPDTRWLSNFTPVVVYYKDIAYASVEHAYVASKVESPKLWQRVLECKTAAEAKKLGKTFPVIDGWDVVKVPLMLGFLRQKFSQEPYRTYLMATHGTIIEGNTWHDNFWGKCSCHYCWNIQHQNNLGKLIMQVREELEEF